MSVFNLGTEGGDGRRSRAITVLPLWHGALVGREKSARDGEEEGRLAHAGAAGDHQVPRLHGAGTAGPL